MVPPDIGAVHQVNLEYLSRVVQVSDNLIYPDSVVGTDSHTTMINGLGILGWGELFFRTSNVLPAPDDLTTITANCIITVVCLLPSPLS